MPTCTRWWPISRVCRRWRTKCPKRCRRGKPRRASRSPFPRCLCGTLPRPRQHLGSNSGTTQFMQLRERMGSGGPPGLQILVSGASGVRGGFDSHAFPPIFALAALWLVLAALAVRPVFADLPPGAPGAAPAPPLDSLVTPLPAAVDTAGKLVNVGSVRRIPAATPDTTHHAYGEPRYVMFRSMLVPGWGQLYNGSWIKATLFVGIEGALITQIVQDEQHLNQLPETANEA